jgi:cytochrome c oxidase cbb3-type subunit 2
MFLREMSFIFVLAVIFFLAAQTVYAEPVMDGKAMYIKYCAPCHGEKGDGKGPVAKAIFPKPRDLTTGTYKIRSTPSGSLPSDSDILSTIKRGMPGTSMIPWDVLDDNQLSQLVPIVKGFSKLFVDEKPDASIKIMNKLPNTAEAVASGKKIYMEKGCFECHGDSGKGDGLKANKLRDDAGNPIYPFDFTSGDNFRGGSADEDIYLRFTTGMTGTPMPSFEESLTEEQRWNLVYYVKSLCVKEDMASLHKNK